MGMLRKTLALGTIAGIVVPPIVAAFAKGRIVPIDDEDADEVSLVTIFDGGRFTSRAKAFRGGTALCWYGGSDIDLREAQLDPAGGRLELRTIFGGVRVIVPEDWQIRIQSRPILGGLSDDTVGGDATGPILEVDSLAVFAGVRITNRLADDDELISPPGVPIAIVKDDGRGPDEARSEVLARAEVEASVEAEASGDAGAEDAGVDEGEAPPAAGAEAPLELETPVDEADPNAAAGG